MQTDNDRAMKARRDEAFVFHLNYLMYLVLALSVVCFATIFAVDADRSIFNQAISWMACIASFFGLMGAVWVGREAEQLKGHRVSAGYTIISYRVDPSDEKHINHKKHPFRPHVYSPEGELIGILYNQSDVAALIEAHIRKHAGLDHIKSLMVPEFTFRQGTNEARSPE